jgi:cobalt-precorrin-5B (C1)-methyltransferase
VPGKPNLPTDDDRRLKYGWTTGACATAAAKAAYSALITGTFPDPVEITLPKGQNPSFELADSRLSKAVACAGVIKDAGDDPDVTHGALIRSCVKFGTAGSGLVFKAGRGVGTVTLAGLPLAVGEPAINPGPRKMIAANIASVRSQHGGPEDIEVTISVKRGAAIAKKTWNGRLGIIGGLSILGTTGIVVPYSCSAWIHSIHRGIDVARAAGYSHVAAATGSTSEKSVAALYNLPMTALLDMGDFAGGTLTYLRKHPIAKLTLAGGFGKISKLAAGHMDLHSSRSQVEPEFLSGLAKKAGGTPELVAAIAACRSAGEALEYTTKAGFALGDAVAVAAREVALAKADGVCDIEIIVFDRRGVMVGRAPFSKP